MEKILTITIPTYNMEKYLRRCLNSLIIGEKQMSQLEVLVINDGSKDNSSTIAHEYEKIFPQTFRVIDKENGNYGSCVNRGLKEATGKYFRLLDADDWFDTNALETLIERLSNLGLCVDMILTSYNEIDVTKNTIKPHTFGNKCQYDKICNFPEIDLVTSADSKLGTFPMHQITYSLDVLKRSDLRHDEGISYTDVEYTYIPLQYVRSFVIFNLNLYQYYVGRLGQTISSAARMKNAGDFFKIFKTLSLLHFNNIDQRSINVLKPQRNVMRCLEGEIIQLILLQMGEDAAIEYKEELGNMLTLTKHKDPILYSDIKKLYRFIPVIWSWEKLGFISPRCFRSLVYMKAKLSNAKNRLKSILTPSKHPKMGYG